MWMKDFERASSNFSNLSLRPFEWARLIWVKISREIRVCENESEGKVFIGEKRKNKTGEKGSLDREISARRNVT